MTSYTHFQEALIFDYGKLDSAERLLELHHLLKEEWGVTLKVTEMEQESKLAV